MKILDKYIIKQYLQVIFFSLLSFTLLFIIIDAMENLDRFIDQNVTTEMIVYYYLVFSPDMIKLMTPVAVLFGALFTTGKLAGSSELTAIRAGGVSLIRFMAPFVFTTIFITTISIFFSGYVVPLANKTKINIELTYLKKGNSFFGSNIFFQDSENRLVGISFFDKNSDQANKVNISYFDSDSPTKLLIRIDAVKMVYDSLKGQWTAFDGVTRSFEGETQKAVYFKKWVLKNLNFTPKDVLKKQQKPQELNLAELSDLIEATKKAGNDPTAVEIEYYSRFAFSATCIVVVLFGLPISTNKRRGNLASQIGLNILVTFLYLVFWKVSMAFGKNGAMNPVLTAWFANFLFLAAALFNLPRMRE